MPTPRLARLLSVRCITVSTSRRESQTNETHKHDNQKSFLSPEAWLAKSWAFICIFRKIVTINFVSSWYIFTTSGVVYFCPHKKLWTICPFHSESELISVPRESQSLVELKLNERFFWKILGVLPACWILCFYTMKWKRQINFDQ